MTKSDVKRKKSKVLSDGRTVLTNKVVKTSSKSKSVGKKGYSKSNNNNKNNYKKYNKNSSKKNKPIKNKIIITLVSIVSMFIIYNAFKIVDSSLNQNEHTTRQGFIDQIEEAAIVGYRDTGVLPSITISQAILESSWGKSELALKGKNLYGIKADSSWFGRKIQFLTKENYSDVENAYFRKYSNWQESIEDYLKFLSQNKRYRNYGLFDKKDYKSQAQALEDAGYATTRNALGEKIYADKLIKIIESRKLYEIDKKVIGS